MGYGSGIKTGLFSKQCSQFDKEIDVANTLLARDYKGFGNQAMNGVIECKESRKTKLKFSEGLFPVQERYIKIKRYITPWGGRSICTLKAVHYKDPPKILIRYETEKKDE